MKMNTIFSKTFLNIIFFSLFLFSLVKPTMAADRVYLDITTTETRKIKIAVPWFVNKSLSQQKQRLGRDLADTLAKSLKFHGIISIIPTSDYGGIQDAQWKKYGTDYTALGQYTISSDSIKLEMRLLDVAGNEVIMGKSFSGSMAQKDKMLFKFCDSVLETLTGKPGIAETRIAFVNRKNNVKEVFLTDILGRKIRQVTRHKHLTVSPRFVPGGNLLSYSSYHTGNQNLYITDLLQSKTTRALSRRKGLNLAPAWSANGKLMILTLSKSGNPDLYLLDNRGEIIEPLTSRAGINVSPTWSPDGKHIVFVSDRSGKPQLYLMEMRTRKVKRITFEGSENAEPNWSPSENKIVYSSLRNGVYQLFTMNPLSNEMPKQLTADLSHHESPNWSPDGNQVIFTKRDGKKDQIYGILKNGSFQRRLFTLPGSQSYPQWAR
ncbi:MAG: protein TolB [Desulfobulbaceae bacterium]|nr:protein TolB [Desulfobulbaceae bacterium]